MTLQVETQEAICSALYQMPFAEFLGEDEVMDEEGSAYVAFFHLGERPKDMRVTVIRPVKKDEIRVRLEWRNYAADARNPLKGEQMLRISTYAATQAMLIAPTEAVVLRILAVYTDVLQEDGVAGMIGDLVETSEDESDE